MQKLKKPRKSLRGLAWIDALKKALSYHRKQNAGYHMKEYKNCVTNKCQK